MHEAFFFGPDDRQIFAVYHPAVGADGRVLTVICPPLFAELNRTYSILRKLAVALAEQGQHVLRLDYSGTGDSFGRLEDMTISDWVEDIKLAVQEGRELSGCSTVRIVSVRASALLASMSIGAANDIERLVLWDPIPDGSKYLQALNREQLAVLEQHHFLDRTMRHKLTCDYDMYRMSEQMMDEFRTIDSDVYSNVPRNKLRVFNTTSADEFPVQGASRDTVRHACNWETNTEGLIMSQPILEGLSKCLTEH